MKDFIFYFPLNSTHLATYISRGIIFPREYLNSSIKDIQSLFETSIVLTKNKWIFIDKFKNDCTLELVLTQYELENLQENGDLFLLSDVIPISRIKSIFFHNEEQKIKTIYNVEKGDGFVPDIAKLDLKPDFLKVTLAKSGIKKNLNLATKIVEFDKLLGAFALMKLTGRISTEYSSNFSEHYFSTLSAINSIIKTECENHNLSTKSNLVGIFDKNSESKWNYQFLKIIAEKPSSADEFAVPLIKFAENNRSVGLLNVIQSSVGVNWNDLGENDSYSIALSVIHRYGQGKRKGLSDLFSDLSSKKIPFPKKIESLLFLYGYHYGYSTLESSAKIKGTIEPIKFELNSQLDYFTIESIYQWVFSNHKVDDYEFLKWVPNYKTNISTKHWILDVPVTGIAENPAAKSLLERIKQNLLDFFLEGDKVKYSSEIIKQLSNAISPKLDSILVEINELETAALAAESIKSDNEKLTKMLNDSYNKENNFRNEQEFFRNQIQKLEKENLALLLQQKTRSDQPIKNESSLENSQLKDDKESVEFNNPHNEPEDKSIEDPEENLTYDDDKYEDTYFPDDQFSSFKEYSSSTKFPSQDYHPNDVSNVNEEIKNETNFDNTRQEANVINNESTPKPWDSDENVGFEDKGADLPELNSETDDKNIATNKISEVEEQPGDVNDEKNNFLSTVEGGGTEHSKNSIQNESETNSDSSGTLFNVPPKKLQKGRISAKTTRNGKK